ncbi:aminoglycoside N(3)-acetyltransferase [Campylobacter lari]|nr:aminoglycoside N(3)-acetyltransferase [Campylobacter lari]EJV5920536.1 aminoglycoside N(3)-acetyltransferase [Campylobacter lari]
MQALFKHNDKIFYKHDLIQVLEKLDIKKGDVLYTHNEIYNFGIPLTDGKTLLQAILDCFFEVIGKEGTLIMPTFTYSFCENKIFDNKNSKTKVGVLNEYFRKQKGVKRTNEPIFSFAIKGAKEELFLKDTTSCFGDDSVFAEIKRQNGKIMLFGNPLVGTTFIHHIEEKTGVSFRYFKEFSGIIIDEHGNKLRKTIQYLVRDYRKKSITSAKIYNNFLQKVGNFKLQPFANAEIAVINSKEFFNEAYKLLKINEQAFLG